MRYHADDIAGEDICLCEVCLSEFQPNVEPHPTDWSRHGFIIECPDCLLRVYGSTHAEAKKNWEQIHRQEEKAKRVDELEEVLRKRDGEIEKLDATIRRCLGD